MNLPPLAVGAGAGLVLALLLAPATGDALGKLAAARADRAKFAAVMNRPAPQPAPLVASEVAAGDNLDLLATRIRGRAHDAGVLVEQIAATKGQGSLIRLKVSFSGSEKAVVAFADALERDSVLVRLQSWRLIPVEGGLRLTGEAVAVRR